MPRTPTFDRKALVVLLERQHQVISRVQALECGMSRPVVRYRCREAGPWRALLPGVYLTHTGSATDEQRDMAALLYAGPRSTQIRTREHEVASNIRAALAAVPGRPLSPVRAVPAR
jgi:hypothetical protein